MEVTQAFIDRCREVNPLLNCVVDERFEAALKDAERADKLIASGTMTVEQLEREKPFLGVPISTKDCIRVEGTGRHHSEVGRSVAEKLTLSMLIQFYRMTSLIIMIY